MPADVSGIGYFAPILAFLIVFVILFAILHRTKLFGKEASPWVLMFVSFLVATIFVSAAGVRDYVLVITPWFAALVVSLFFMIFLVRFVGEKSEFMDKGIGITAVLVLIIIFLVSGFIVFSESIAPYLPGSSGIGADPTLFVLSREFYQTRVFGALLLLGISAIVSWVLVRSAKK